MGNRSVTDLRLKIQNNTSRTVVASWNFNNSDNKLDSFNYVWKYWSGDRETLPRMVKKSRQKKVREKVPITKGSGKRKKTVGYKYVTKTTTEYYWVQQGTYQKDLWLDGASGTLSNTPPTGVATTCVYTPPDNAIQVTFNITPVSKTHKVKNTDVSYWNGTRSGSWMALDTTAKPSTPSQPTINVDLNTLQLYGGIQNYTSNDGSSAQIFFDWELYRGGIGHNEIFNRRQTGISYLNSGGYNCKIQSGYSEWALRVRARRGTRGTPSEWSSFTYYTNPIPDSIGKFIEAKAESSTGVYLKWNGANGATEYVIEYMQGSSNFDSSNGSTSITVKATEAHVTGLETGKTYYFRAKAKNDSNESHWQDRKYWVGIPVGSTPSAPTTWSETTTAIIGEKDILYWVHNSEDGSSEVAAQLSITIGENTTVADITNTTGDNTKQYELDTSSLHDGDIVKWKVRTKGITGVYSDWSVVREIKLYSQPSVNAIIEDATDSEVTSYPISVKMTVGDTTQTPISYSLSITSNDDYDTVDVLGGNTKVMKGDQVYSGYWTTSETELVQKITPGEVMLEHDVTYTMTLSVAFDSGLAAEYSMEFTVNIDQANAVLSPDMEIGIDDEDVSALLSASCKDSDGNFIKDVTLSIYRREFDGGLKAIAVGLANEDSIYAVDPHPALDYARYRVVAVNEKTGATGFTDIPEYPVGCTDIILQWDEEPSRYFKIDSGSEDGDSDESVGSILRLPFNIDISEQNSSDVALVEYIGRQHPVSYYGTQLGQTATWNTDVDANDAEIVYALRRLQAYMGDVYVREPSGTGYWANVKVSFSKKHGDLVIPVALTITRVEGGD